MAGNLYEEEIHRSVLLFLIFYKPLVNLLLMDVQSTNFILCLFISLNKAIGQHENFLSLALEFTHEFLFLRR